MSKITSFEEACKALNIEPTVPDFSAVPETDRKSFEAYYKLVIIAKALNEGWKPNWNDSDECKYYPWFDVDATAEQTSGVGLSYNVSSYDYSHSFVGSRLMFKTAELAKYAGKQFNELYADYFLLK